MAHTFPEHRPFTQSPLSESEWRGFFQNGFCIIKGLLSRSEVIETRQALIMLLEQAELLATEQPPEFDGAVYDKGAKFVMKNNAHSQLERLYRVCGCGSVNPVLLDASRHPVLLDAFHDLLMSDSFEQLICQFHAKTPGDNVSFQPHRDIEFRLNCDPDWRDVNHWGSYVVAVIAIDKAGPENGGLYLAPGSQKQCQTEKPATCPRSL